MQMLEGIANGICPGKCGPAYLAETFSELYKFNDMELILVREKAIRDFNHENEEAKSQINAEYGTDECHKNSCLAPYFLRQLLKIKHIPEYVFLDIREVSRYKYERSQKEGHDIGWERAFSEWAASSSNPGFARMFEKRSNGR